MSDAELLADLAQVTLRPVAIAHDRRAADDLELLDFDQAGEEVVLHAVREKGVPLVFAPVLERQNRNALRRDFQALRSENGSIMPPRDSAKRQPRSRSDRP